MLKRLPILLRGVLLTLDGTFSYHYGKRVIIVSWTYYTGSLFSFENTIALNLHESVCSSCVFSYNSKSIENSNMFWNKMHINTGIFIIFIKDPVTRVFRRPNALRYIGARNELKMEKNPRKR
uniref:Uncharacterized protein n=1 Tax=Glossina austeni TaxID=7395 RepID=A0A1A9VMJ1_GLOAU